MVTLQTGLSAGEQFVQPEKFQPEAGVAVSVTEEALAKLAEHPEPLPQLMPDGLLLIVPDPVFVTVKL